MTTPAEPRVLYLVYWGAAEPLGQALVLPAVERLQALGARMTLVTFDKPNDLADRGRVAGIRARFEGQGIRWVSLRYHKTPQIPAKLLDFATALTRSVLRPGRVDIVHARTFYGGVMGLPLARLLRAKLVFHNEGFYPDEMVDGGAWRAGSTLHRTGRALEDRLYRRADGLIVLSRRAKEAIEGRLLSVGSKPVLVVPSAVALDRFRPGANGRGSDAKLRLVYTGSIGLRYLFDHLARYAVVARGALGSVHLRVLSRAEPASIAAILAASGLPRDAWSVDSKPYDEVATELKQSDAGLFFLTQGLSEHACSPTKIGEYWACGIPVVTTPNVGDTDEIVRRERVGVVVNGHTDEAYASAANDLAGLLHDPELRTRCRQAAERHYALEPSCEAQMDLYRRLLESERRAP